MKVTLIQMDIAWGNAPVNLRRAEHLMRGAVGSDLYVLPEMFTTGFASVPYDVAEQAEGNSVQWMRHMADSLNAAVAGSVCVQTASGDYRNRMYFVKPGGDISHYDKRHLFTYGGEDKAYTRGESTVTVEWRGVRFMLQVCYDLRFPVFSRNDSDYDVALYVASWPESRIDVWRTLLKARAIENQCYAVGVNRCGDDPVAHYCGATMAFDAYGNVVASCEDNTESVGVMTVDMERLTRFRERFPVLADADHIITEDNTPWR